MQDRSPTEAGRKEWVGLALLALPTMLVGLDMTVLHLAIPTISASLNPSSAEQLWIVDIYGFLVAGFLITMGTLGDRIGRRRLLLIGAGSFGLISLLAAFAPNTTTLLLARALLGIAGATLLPSTLSLISNMFKHDDQRRFAIAVWMTTLLVGGAIGPVVGGVLLEHFWWGSVFLLGIPLPAVLVLAAPLVLPEYRNPHAGRLDPISVILSLGAILPVVYGIKEAAQNGQSLRSLVAVIVGLVAGAVFVRRQIKATEPLMDISLFRQTPFSVALGAQTVALFVQTGMQFLALQYFQGVLEMSPLQAGLWVLPALAAGISGSLLAPGLTRWVTQATVMTIGFLITLGGLACLGLLYPATASLWLSASGLAIVFFGTSVALALTNDLIIAGAPPERAGNAAGVGETGAELGNALGVALSGSVATAVYRAGFSDTSLTANMDRSTVDAARDTLGNAIAVAARLPDDIGTGLLAAAQTAFSRGVQFAVVIDAALVLVVIATVSILLRHRFDGPDDIAANKSTDSGSR